MNGTKREKEIEKRERLVQTFLIIGGFFVANATEQARQATAILFTTYLLFIILYYVYISRTRNHFLVDILAIISSIFYSLLMLVVMITQMPNSSWNTLFLFIALSGTLSYSLLSPEGSEYITNLPKKISDELAKAESLRRIAKMVNIRHGIDK